jgi:SAM-dependent methyltransferase
MDHAGTPPRCVVCGERNYTDRAVLWRGLVDEWRLSPEEWRYIDRQQGTLCGGCGANLRSIALAVAILDVLGWPAPLTAAIDRPDAARLRLLEINDAGNLTPLLARLPGRVHAAYPEIDMHAMPYADSAFDLVVHSDTLEHVAQPIRALAECRRVLAPGGALCLTVPHVVGRLTQSRAGLPPSHHGNAAEQPDDHLVHTEFGADSWTYLARAGFGTIAYHVFEHPAAIALSARG